MTNADLPLLEGAYEQLIRLTNGSVVDFDRFVHHVNQRLKVDPDINWYLCLAMIYWRSGDYKSALHNLDAAIPLGANQNPLALQMRGMVCRQIPGMENMARKAYEQSIVINPNQNDCLYNLANLIVDDDPLSALDYYIRSLKIQPMMASAWHNLGKLYLDLDRLDSAFKCLNKSLCLDSSVADVWCNLGLTYLASQNYQATEKCFRHAISLDSNHSESHINMGSIMMDVLGPEEALSYLHRGVELESSSANSLWNLALAYLLLGDYAQGWRYYEARFATKQFSTSEFPSSGKVPDNLSDCPKDTDLPLLVWCEQGIGDAIQFIRYVALLDAAGINYIVQVRQSLYDLFRDWLNIQDRLVLEGCLTDNQKKLPHISVMSLPRLFQTTIETVPCHTPYLKSKVSTPDSFIVPPAPGGLSVGIVWATNPENKSMYRHKSLPLQILMPSLSKLISLDLINLHSLQVGADSAEIQDFVDGNRIFDWGNKLLSFSDTANVVSQLDLVISVDTAVAHLSGALNIPTWTLIPFNCDYRWMRSRVDTPWYPSMRLFRQTSLGDWSSVVAELNSAFDSLFAIKFEDVCASRS